MTGTGTAVLETERIERMRANIMDTVTELEREQSARRGRRRSRMALGLAAAAVVTIAGLGLGDGLTGMGGSSDSDISAGSTADRRTSEQMAPGDAPESRIEQPTDTSGDIDPTVIAPSIITTGSMSVEVDDVDAAIRAVRTFARTQGGRIDGENFEESDPAPYADLTVRIPASGVTALRAELDDLGTVEGVQLEQSDVSAEVADVNARIASLEASIRRLRAIVADSDTTKDLLDAEAQLSRRQSDLESLQAQQRVLRNQTSLATVHVSLHTAESAQAVEPSGFFGGLTRGWNALVDTTNAVVTGAGVLVPWLLPLGILAGITLFVRRRMRRS